jgi:hypothetical protein
MNQNSDSIVLEKLTGRVDRDNHIIRGVSLLTAGPLTGHDMEADHDTLRQALGLIPTNGLKAKLNHRDATGVLSINGKFKNARIEGNHLRADWHLNPAMDTTPKVLALAEFQPEDAGISFRSVTTRERKNGKTYMRMTGPLKSADLVDDAAGNESLFSADSSSEVELSEMMAEATVLESLSGLAMIHERSRLDKKYAGNFRSKLAELTAKENVPLTELEQIQDECTHLESLSGLARTYERLRLDRKYGGNVRTKLAELTAKETLPLTELQEDASGDEEAFSFDFESSENSDLSLCELAAKWRDLLAD